MDSIRNIIFDLGGVIMDIDVKRTLQAFKDLGAQNIQDYFGHGFAASFFSDHETGRISDEEFIGNIRQLLSGTSNQPSGVQEEAVINAWNALLLDFPPERIALLRSLKGRYRVFLYSNTNAIHYNKFSEIYAGAYTGRLEDLFEKAYFSHVLGQRKPDLNGFKQIIDENGLNPAETLFVDDAFINVEGSIKAGLKGLYLPPGFYITDIKW
jgi:glucose-1-phosphatase